MCDGRASLVIASHGVPHRNDRFSRTMKILLATDGSSHAQAAESLLTSLPVPSDSELCLVAVVESPTWQSDVASEHAALREELAGYRREVEERLEREVERLKSRFGRVSGVVLSGNVVEQICQLATDRQADLIVAGAGEVRRFVAGCWEGHPTDWHAMPPATYWLSVHGTIRRTGARAQAGACCDRWFCVVSGSRGTAGFPPSGRGVRSHCLSGAGGCPFVPDGYRRAERRAVGGGAPTGSR